MDAIKDISFPNLGFYFSDVPSGITIFGREIKFYAMIIAVAFCLALFFANREAKRTKQDPELYVDAFLTVVIPAILGARLYYVIFSWSEFKDDWKSIFAIWNGGLAIYGGVLVGILTLFIFAKIRKVSFALMLDTLVPGLVLGQCLGRWGNFFNREAFGGDSDGLFAMRLPVEGVHVSYSPSVTVHTPENGLAYLQVQPTFFYESCLCLVIFIVLLLLRRKKKVDGEVFLLYAFLYGIGRFAIESMRTDQLILGKIGGTAIPVSQVVALGFVLLAVIMFFVGRKRMDVSFYMEDNGEEDASAEQKITAD